MAMIFELDVPKEELDAIAAFMRGDAEEVPEIGELATKVLDRLINKPKGLWVVDIGSFVEYKRLPPISIDDRPFYETPSGEVVSYADALYDKEGKTTGLWGLVQTDFVQPDAAFEIGVPL